MGELTPLVPESKLCQLIRERMKELGLSQRRIASELDIPQSQISRSLSGGRGLRYDELQKIIEYILSLESLVQSDVRAVDLAVPLEKMDWVYSSVSIGKVAELMLKGGFSQIPVKDEGRDVFTGVVTDLGILKSMVLPASVGDGVVSLSDLREMSVQRSGLEEAIPYIPLDVPLNVVAQMLTYFPALLLQDDLGKVKGIITRADLLEQFKASE